MFDHQDMESDDTETFIPAGLAASLVVLKALRPLQGLVEGDCEQRTKKGRGERDDETQFKFAHERAPAS